MSKIIRVEYELWMNDHGKQLVLRAVSEDLEEIQSKINHGIAWEILIKRTEQVTTVEWDHHSSNGAGWGQ